MRDQAIDPRHRFSIRDDSGRATHVRVYWEELHAFTFRDRTVLAATRVVPHSSRQYALYEALKSSGDTGGASTAEDGSAEDLILRVSDALASFDVAGSQDHDFGVEAESVVSSVLVQRGLSSGLETFSDPSQVAALDDRFVAPGDVLHALAESEGADAGLVNLSFHVDRALKSYVVEEFGKTQSTGSLVRGSDLEDGLLARLYANPNYMGFVKRLMKARGGYISPVVRDFLSFYARQLDRGLDQLAERDGLDREALSHEVEGVLGRSRGDSHHYLNYHDVTILGYVDGEALRTDAADPDRSGLSRKLDGDLDIQALEIQKIEPGPIRTIIRKMIEYDFNTRHNVKSIQFCDENRHQEGFLSRLGRFLETAGRERGLGNVREGRMVAVVFLVAGVAGIVSMAVIVARLLAAL